MTFSLFSFAAVFLSSAAAAMGLGGGTILLLYLSFFSTLSQPQMQSLNLLLFLPAAGLSLYFHRKNKLIDTAVLSRCILSGAVGGVVGSLLDFQSHRPTAAAALLRNFSAVHRSAGGIPCSQADLQKLFPPQSINGSCRCKIQSEETSYLRKD